MLICLCLIFVNFELCKRVVNVKLSIIRLCKFLRLLIVKLWLIVFKLLICIGLVCFCVFGLFFRFSLMYLDSILDVFRGLGSLIMLYSIDRVDMCFFMVVCLSFEVINLLM